MGILRKADRDITHGCRAVPFKPNISSDFA